MLLILSQENENLMINSESIMWSNESDAESFSIPNLTYATRPP